MSLEQREHGTELSQGGAQKCTWVISSTQRYTEEFAIGLRHPETSSESGEKSRMAPSTHPPLWDTDSGARERINDTELLL